MFSLAKDKALYRTIATIAIPITLQNLINFSVNMTDTVMLGFMGQTQLSASALANQPYFVFTLLLFGITSGASVLTAQYWGKGDTDAINRITNIALKVSIGFSLLVSFTLFFFPSQIMAIFTDNQTLIAEGTNYLRIIAPSYILSAVTMTYLNLLRSVEVVRISLIISLVSFLINVFLNWLLIFGNLGFPRLGIMGSATATLIARFFEIVCVFLYIGLGKPKVTIKIKHFFKTDMVLLRDLFQYSTPVVFNELLWGLGMSMQMVVLGRMGAEAVAAASIANVVQRLSTVYVMGMASAAAVIVGKMIGEGDQHKTKSAATKILVISLILGILSATAMFFCRSFTTTYYNVPEQTKMIAENIMMFGAIIVFFSSFNATNIVGILRAGGDTKFALAIDISFLWLVAVPCGAIAGLLLHWPVPIVFFILMIDDPIKFLIGIARFKSGKWMQNLTREFIVNE